MNETADHRTGTLPPPKHRNKQHHWLVAERASYPSVAEWMDGQWWCAGEKESVSADEMWRRGWRWGAVAKPPKWMTA